MSAWKGIFLHIMLAEFQLMQCLICLKWSIYENHLHLSCTTDQLYLSVSLLDPNGKEQGYCLSPKPTSTCITTFRNMNISQNVAKKETSLTLLQATDKNLSGQWSCLHGTKTEKATTSVKDIMPLLHGQPFTVVKLKAPKYIKRGKNVHLECSIVDSLKSEPVYLVTFFIDDAPVVKFKKTDVSCQLSETSELFEENSCLCLNGGTRYVVQHKGFNVSNVIKFTCNIESAIGVIFSDCSLSTVVDMDGPHISTNVEFPIYNGTKVQFNCSVDDTSFFVNLVWNCPWRLKEDHHNLDHGHFITSSHVIDSSLDNDNCTCSAYIDDSFIASESTQIFTKHIPVIAKTTNTVCQVSGAVKLTCSIVNVKDFSMYGFLNWTHTRNGKVMKHPEGAINGNTAVLYILNCKSNDSGEYTCNMWTEDSNYRTWTNETINVAIEELEQKSKIFTEYIPYIVSGSIVFLIGLCVFVKHRVLGNPDAIAVYHAAPLNQRSSHIYQSCIIYEEIGPGQAGTPTDPIHEYEEANKSDTEPHEYEIGHHYIEMK